MKQKWKPTQTCLPEENNNVRQGGKSVQLLAPTEPQALPSIRHLKKNGASPHQQIISDTVKTDEYATSRPLAAAWRAPAKGLSCLPCF